MRERPLPLPQRLERHRGVASKAAHELEVACRIGARPPGLHRVRRGRTRKGGSRLTTVIGFTDRPRSLEVEQHPGPDSSGGGGGGRRWELGVVPVY